MGLRWYNEPPDWYYTVRESLGRRSGRSLNGPKLSLQAQNGKVVSADLEDKLQIAWCNATVSAKP